MWPAIEAKIGTQGLVLAQGSSSSLSNRAAVFHICNCVKCNCALTECRKRKKKVQCIRTPLASKVGRAGFAIELLALLSLAPRAPLW